ncbi:ATP-binding protein [candidate division KSB1 bacterium]|nr:ATP-binding protein [candidate division KSB1 bacterium]
MLLNPFMHTQPFKNDIFIGRDFEIYLAVSNIIKNQSTVIVGAPGFGRTSLLNYIKDNLVQLLPSNCSNEFYPIYINLSDLASDRKFSPANFWKTLKTALETKYPDLISEIFSQKVEINFYHIREILTNLAQQNQKIVLLLDEFSLLYDEHAQVESSVPIDFHNQLRILATARDSSIVIICTTKELLTALNQISGGSDGLWYSPLIDIFAVHYLRGFSESDLHELNTKILTAHPNQFTHEDLTFISQVTAGIPVLVQIAAAYIFDQRNKLGWTKFVQSQELNLWIKEIYRKAEIYLTKIWNCFSFEEKLILMYIVIAHRGGRVVRGMRYKITSNDPDLFGFGGWRVKRPEAFQLVIRREKEDRFEISSPLFENFIIEQIRKNEIPDLVERETRMIFFSRKQFVKILAIINDNKSEFIRFTLDSFSEWLFQN